MKDLYPLATLILGGILISLSLLYKYLLQNNKRFMELFYCGHLLVIAGVVTSGYASFIVIFFCALIFLIVSIWFFIVNRNLKGN